ncbi:hypothetical protein VNO77_44684 [Canavalia gladiata]|uniref:Uncharacterized protein n=1 Tax=Canavalia gladiata TaxID=3824 RepID=A0AAN9JXG4_CANGL
MFSMAFLNFAEGLTMGIWHVSLAFLFVLGFSLKNVSWAGLYDNFLGLGSVVPYLPESLTNSTYGATDSELCRANSAAFVSKFVTMVSFSFSA